MSREEFVTFRREELEQFFGAVALPPGSGAPLDTDCAPIAQRIEQWIAEHELPSADDPCLLWLIAASEHFKKAHQFSAPRLARYWDGRLELLLELRDALERSETA